MAGYLPRYTSTFVTLIERMGWSFLRNDPRKQLQDANRSQDEQCGLRSWGRQTV